MSDQLSIQRAPCASCPYRRDVPSGIWSAEEYDKILPYDNETMFQPPSIFLCHQQNGCLCRGWLDTHGTELLALRLGCIKGEIDPAELGKAIDEGPAVDVFETAADAAVHGRKSIKRPGAKAKRMMEKIEGRRSRTMNDTWTKLASCDEDVTNIMRWWLVKKADKKYLRLALKVGGVREVIQETCLTIIASGPKDIACNWTTAAVNQTRWTLLRMAKKLITREEAESKFLNTLWHEVAIYDDIQFECAVNRELAERLSMCVKSLSHRERAVIELRMQETTLDEIGFALKVSRARVSQIEAKAIRKLMMPGIAQKLFTFLDR